MCVDETNPDYYEIRVDWTHPYKVLSITRRHCTLHDAKVNEGKLKRTHVLEEIESTI